MLQRTIFDNRPVRWCMHYFAIFYFWVNKWKISATVNPSKKKCVVVCAPHTTWLDTPYIWLLAFYFDMRIYWLGKEEMFRWPFGGFMLWLGGISVDRSQKGLDRTSIYGKALREEEKPTQLVIAPSGTRKNIPVAQWSRGYKDIAEKAGVPIVLGYIDYRERNARIGAKIDSARDYNQVVADIERFYAKHVPIQRTAQ